MQYSMNHSSGSLTIQGGSEWRDFKLDFVSKYHYENVPNGISIILVQCQQHAATKAAANTMVNSEVGEGIPVAFSTPYNAENRAEIEIKNIEIMSSAEASFEPSIPRFSPEFIDLGRNVTWEELNKLTLEDLRLPDPRKVVWKNGKPLVEGDSQCANPKSPDKPIKNHNREDAVDKTFIETSENTYKDTVREWEKPNVKNLVSTIPSHLKFESSLRNLADQVVESLMDPERGYFLFDGFLSHELSKRVLIEVKNLKDSGYMSSGELINMNNIVGEKTEYSSEKNSNVREDLVYWIKEDDLPRIPFTDLYLKTIDELSRCISSPNGTNFSNDLGRNLFYSSGKHISNIITGRTRAMATCYPNNSQGYLYHVDNPIKDGRCLTFLYYLNEDWNSENGGGLVIYPSGLSSKMPEGIMIEPKLDRILVFWSDCRTPHQVLPSNKDRYAITVWYFDAIERAAAAQKYK